MDPLGIVGIVIALSSVVGLMVVEGTSPMAILLPGPMIIVLLGTIGAGLAGSVWVDVKWAVKNLPRALVGKAPQPGETIDTIVHLADRARREGMLALEEEIRTIDDPFLKQGLNAAIDGADSDELREMLEGVITTKRNQDKIAAKFFMELGGYAPTIGIIGTVVSLVHVLENLSDVVALGPMIASAFVATLWGVMTANMIWLPIGNRLTRLSAMECAQMEITLEGLLSLQSGASPRIVVSRLNSLLPAQHQDQQKQKKAA